jgi:hypothetical protein
MYKFSLLFQWNSDMISKFETESIFCYTKNLYVIEPIKWRSYEPLTLRHIYSEAITNDLLNTMIVSYVVMALVMCINILKAKVTVKYAVRTYIQLEWTILF